MRGAGRRDGGRREAGVAEPVQPRAELGAVVLEHLQRLRQAQQLRQALEVLDRYAPEKKSMFAGLPGKDLIPQADYDAVCARRQDIIAAAQDVLNKEKAIGEQRGSIARLENQMEALTPWLNLDVPMSFRGTKATRLLLGAVPGSFAGVYLLQICSGAVLQGIVGILLLFFVYWQLYVHGGRGGGARLQPVGVACGFGAGLLGTGIALDGPPMAAFGLAVGWEPRVFLGTVSVFFMLRGIITLVLQWWHGFFTPEVLGMAMYGTPGVMLGSLAAFPVVKRINVLLFRRVLLAIIAICGVVCLVRSIW